MEKYTGTIWTYKDYCKLPPDQKRRIYQIIEGALTMVPAPNSHHQDILTEILFQIVSFVKKTKAGKVFPAPTDVILSETDIVQPDILFISKDRKNIIRKKGIFGAPDLVIEIESPSTQKLDETIKKELYEKHGAREYLIFYPEEKKVLQYAREKGFFQNKGIFISPDTLPLHTLDTSLSLKEIFTE